MTNKKTQRIKTISEFHRFRGLPKPLNPLISIIDFAAIKHTGEYIPTSWVNSFYSISLKRTSNATMKYGQREYDFDDGVLFFMAPNQVFSVEPNSKVLPKHSGWLLLIHPDFLWNTQTAKNIKKYEYFNYSANEALFLSDKEESVITGIVKNIEQEYHSNIDKFSQGVIIAQLELLLTYSERFYERQFITRKKENHGILDRLEKILDEHFDNNNGIEKGLPTVQYVADTLNVSPGYLSGLLKVLTGQSTQNHIHEKLIGKAKERLSTTELSVSEIAYELGFEHPPSFSKLFKKKTDLSPQDFRRTFN